MREYRVALIGCGNRAPAHIAAYQHIPNARVVACAAPSPTRRDPLAARFGLRAYSDPAEMIEAEKPDMVHIVTRPDVRVPLMKLVDRLGVPLCTVEKPVATGVADWRELRALERNAKTRFAVCHQFRWYSDFVRCRESVERGDIGDVHLLELSCGMNAAGQGTHVLNYGLALAGDARVALVFGNASGWETRDKVHPAPETTAAYLVLETGARAVWTTGRVSPRCGDPATTWQHVRVAVHGSKGRVAWEEFGKWEIVSQARTEGAPFQGMDAWQRNNTLAQAAFHRAMFDWFEDDSKVPGTHLRQSLHEWAVVLALYQSALERRPIEMEGFEPEDGLVERLESALCNS